MPARVYIVSPTESYLTKRGKRHPKLADYLVRKGYDLEYVSTTINHAEKVLFQRSEVEEAQRRVLYKLTLIDAGLYTSNHCFRRLRFHQSLAWKILRYLSRKVRSGDIVIIPSRPPELVWCVSRLKKSKRIKTILDLEDLWGSFSLGYNGLGFHVFGRYCDLLQARSIPTYDRYVHISEQNSRYLQQYAPDASSEFLPLGFDPARWSHCRPKCGAENGRRIKIYYCGSLSEEFNVLPVVVAVGRMPDRYEMVLIGCSRNDTYYSEIVDFVTRERPQNVALKGIVPPEEAAALISEQDVAAIPVRSAALPNKFFDAIGSYTPMLVCGQDDCADLVKKHDIGWVTSQDPGAIADVLRRLDFRGIVSKSNNIAGCREQYSHERINERYEQVVRDLIKQS